MHESILKTIGFLSVDRCSGYHCDISTCRYILPKFYLTGLLYFRYFQRSRRTPVFFPFFFFFLHKYQIANTSTQIIKTCINIELSIVFPRLSSQPVRFVLSSRDVTRLNRRGVKMCVRPTLIIESIFRLAAHPPPILR